MQNAWVVFSKDILVLANSVPDVHTSVRSSDSRSITSIFNSLSGSFEKEFLLRFKEKSFIGFYFKELSVESVH